MSWADIAMKLAKGAERAHEAGDETASLVLSLKAAECLMIAKALEKYSDDPPADAGGERSPNCDSEK